MRDVQSLVDAADESALLIAVDGLCASRQWEALVDLARRCLDAVEWGKQLWPVATYIDYRLAWEGPPEYAAATLRPGAGRFALGPLTEVAACTHTWDQLARHLTDPVVAGAVAQERVIRGEDLTGRAGDVTTDLPLSLAPWEPDYALPRYADRSARFPAPRAGEQLGGVPTRVPQGHPLDADSAARALSDTVRAWTAESKGAVRVAVVEGSAAAAVGCLSSTAVLSELPPGDALALLQWAGASGGAVGRRPGGAAGRFAALWAACALSGLEWPDEDLEGFMPALGAALRELDWVRWRGPDAEQGWFLRLAVSDPADGLAWAVEATDKVDDGDPAAALAPA